MHNPDILAHGVHRFEYLYTNEASMIKKNIKYFFETIHGSLFLSVLVYASAYTLLTVIVNTFELRDVLFYPNYNIVDAAIVGAVMGIAVFEIRRIKKKKEEKKQT